MSGTATGAWSRESLRGSLKEVDAWWTVLVIDPLALRVLPWLLRRRRVTPNALSLLAGSVGVGSGAAFLWGAPIVGGLLFELRFFIDCLDGKVARVRGIGSRFGGFLDQSLDLVVMSWVYSALGLELASKGALPGRLALWPAVAALVWAWSGQYLGVTRRALAMAGAGPKAEGGGLRSRMRSRRLARLPSSVEATTVALFLCPLTGSPSIMAGALWVVTVGFYVPATAHNFYSTARMLRRADLASAVPADAVPPVASSRHPSPSASPL